MEATSQKVIEGGGGFPSEQRRSFFRQEDTNDQGSLKLGLSQLQLPFVWKFVKVIFRGSLTKFLRWLEYCVKSVNSFVFLVYISTLCDNTCYNLSMLSLVVPRVEFFQQYSLAWVHFYTAWKQTPSSLPSNFVSSSSRTICYDSTSAIHLVFSHILNKNLEKALLW